MIYRDDGKQFGGIVDSTEVDKFNKLSAEWWDPEGSFSPLHKINDVRLSYISGTIARHFGKCCRGDGVWVPDLNGITALDVGCGGGLISEPIARLGAKVTGIDVGDRNIMVASQHAKQSELDIEYICGDCTSIRRGRKFDVVMSLEVVEHVLDPAVFISSCAERMACGGLIFISTINRSFKSFAGAIIAAEYILKWLPRRTHQWSRFITPDEMKNFLHCSGVKYIDIKGIVYDILRGGWKISDYDTSINYIMVGTKL